jgi:plastocyanin
MSRTFIFVFLVGACGGGSSSPDARKDSSSATVMAVDCTANPPAQTIAEQDPMFNFIPTSVTINQNQDVKFMTSSSHDVVPNTTMSDPGINVPFNMTVCLKFTAKGTFGFHCGPHGFQGTVIVQ